MGEGLGYFTAVYRDGRVHIGNKSYAAGVYAVHLLNQYYKNDTAARIAVYKQYILQVRRQLEIGYLNESDFEKAGEEIQSILKTLPTIPEDMRKAFELLKRFVSRVDEADRFDEYHLLPIATEMFGTNSFPLHTEYIALPKRRNSRIFVTARRMAFESYYSLVLTDFFEGLHHGHYPRQCEVCKQYFLMQSARRQKYCTYGTAPELYHGEKISCRRYAIIQGKAERAKDNPLKAAYDRRCSAIRSEKSRGTISAEFAAAAQDMAKRRLEQAEEDDAYAKTSYYADLQRTKLYADTDKKNEMTGGASGVRRTE